MWSSVFYYYYYLRVGFEFVVVDLVPRPCFSPLSFSSVFPPPTGRRAHGQDRPNAVPAQCLRLPGRVRLFLRSDTSTGPAVAEGESGPVFLGGLDHSGSPSLPPSPIGPGSVAFAPKRPSPGPAARVASPADQAAPGEDGPAGGGQGRVLKEQGARRASRASPVCAR